MIDRRRFIELAATSVLAPALGGDRATAEVWPARPITLVIGVAAGGPTDAVARVLASGLAKRLGQQVVVDSRPGASGTIAAGQVARAAPDGYTLYAIPGGHATTAAMYRKLPYRTIDDFAMISMTIEFAFLIVTHSDHPIRTMADLIGTARSRTSPLLYGTPGIGSTHHLAIELLAGMANTKFQQVPYRGGAPAITDLLGKRLDFVIDPPAALLEFVRTGRLRALAVTSPTRLPDLPDVPTIAEAAVPGYAVTSWQGLAAPAGLPAMMVRRLNAEVTGVLAEPIAIAQLQALGTLPRPSTPDELRDRVAADVRKWTELVATAKIERI
jgi:tripartite-type tricarboxylate transporter receptor subunit TctC